MQLALSFDVGKVDRTVDLRELSDRIEIPSTLTRYATGLDIPGRDFSEWDKVFAADARFINWNGPGSEMSIPEMQKFLTMDDPVYSHQHLLSNVVITSLDGDRATTRAEYFHVGAHRTTSQEESNLIFKGGFYEDEFIRTPEGWRIIRHSITRRWDKYEVVPWPPANTTWARTEMAPESLEEEN
ncbi:nuclear transport factor 2 family protein [Leucobacter sp. W1038]|uniref:nuclear transport factor 2 family protein n=1 Tax=Leucobacter sp. W1038 TaxID=3438281 RepID=UPI003D974611